MTCSPKSAHRQCDLDSGGGRDKQEPVSGTGRGDSTISGRMARIGGGGVGGEGDGVAGGVRKDSVSDYFLRVGIQISIAQNITVPMVSAISHHSARISPENHVPGESRIPRYTSVPARAAASVAIVKAMPSLRAMFESSMSFIVAGFYQETS